MSDPVDRPSAQRAHVPHVVRSVAICNHPTSNSTRSPDSDCPAHRISNRNTTAFKIHRNSHKTQHITFSNRNITSTVAISFSSPISPRPPSSVSHFPSRSLSFAAISTPYTSRSRNQLNSLKTNAGPDFYPGHLDTLCVCKPRYALRFFRSAAALPPLSSSSHRRSTTHLGDPRPQPLPRLTPSSRGAQRRPVLTQEGRISLRFRRATDLHHGATQLARLLPSSPPLSHNFLSSIFVFPFPPLLIENGLCD